MNADLRYLAFGLVVLMTYWYTVSHGIVYVAADTIVTPDGPGSHGGGGSRGGGFFWSTGFHGGK